MVSQTTDSITRPPNYDDDQRLFHSRNIQVLDGKREESQKFTGRFASSHHNTKIKGQKQGTECKDSQSKSVGTRQGTGKGFQLESAAPSSSQECHIRPIQQVSINAITNQNLLPRILPIESRMYQILFGLLLFVSVYQDVSY